MTSAVELLAELDRLGVNVGVKNDQLWCEPKVVGDSLLIGVKVFDDGLWCEFEEVLSEFRVNLLHRCKTELMAVLDPDTPRCDRCHGTEFNDTSIHGGRSVRRDCARCGRFHSFPVWYEKEDY